MARKPTGEEIKKMRREYSLWTEHDKRISKIAFGAYCERRREQSKKAREKAGTVA